MSTERAGLSEQTASTRPAARWQSESASEPMIRSRWARSATFGASLATRDVSVASKDEDLDLVLRPHGPERLAVQPRALAASSRPLLAGAEVVDEAEDDVVHRLPLRDGDREGEERDAALRVERAVDRVDDDERQPPVAEAADLLRDDRRLPPRATARG